MSLPFMPLYVGDYLADTGHLCAAEHGAYLMLIMHYWRQGGLPIDDRQLARIARMSDREWGKARSIIAAFFDADWKHTRIDQELEKAARKSESRSDAGHRGGVAKALKFKKADVANATILPEQNHADVLASSSQPQSEDRSSHSSSARAATAPKPARISRPKVKTQIAEDAQPDERQRADAAEVGVAADLFRTEWRKFRDHHRSKGTAFVDWHAAWRMWLGRVPAFQPRAGPAPARRNPDLEAFEILRREDERRHENPKTTTSLATSALAIFDACGEPVSE